MKAGIVLVRSLVAAGIVLPLLAGCGVTRGLFATLGPDYAGAPDIPAKTWNTPVAVPATLVPVAHGGSADALRQWWRQFDDPVLLELLASAQRESATLAQAAARIERARADVVAANAVGSPSLDATAGATRSAFSFGGPSIQRTQVQIGVQSSWEIDLFGGLARQRESTRAKLDANVAAWHDARVSVAAELANAYVNFRFCEIQAELAKVDAVSRAETARLQAITAAAGLQSSANAALARASAAEAAALLLQRRAQCEIDIKGLVALTGTDESGLRKKLARAPGAAPSPPRPAQFAIDALPARVLAQRPDVAAAERDLAAASADIGVIDAERYPRLSIDGNVTPTRSQLDGSPAINLRTWSIGPALSLPILDGGRRAANVDAARAQYAAAEAAYRGKVRVAVREVEEAMVRLTGAATRISETRIAAAGYRENLDGVRARQRAGLASLIELEEVRRASLAAEANVAALDHEGVAAWIALYRAAGGGWDGALDATAGFAQRRAEANNHEFTNRNAVK